MASPGAATKTAGIGRSIRLIVSIDKLWPREAVQAALETAIRAPNGRVILRSAKSWRSTVSPPFDGLLKTFNLVFRHRQKEFIESLFPGSYGEVTVLSQSNDR
jgi:hypothetical protein